MNEETIQLLRCMRKGVEDALVDIHNDERASLPIPRSWQALVLVDAARGAYNEGHNLGRAIRAEINERIAEALNRRDGKP